MTDLLSVAEVLARIPGIVGDTTRYRPLKGGLSNRSFLVETDERTLVLRLDSEQTGQFGLNRELELAILENAARRKLAPATVFAEPAAGILVYEYLPGRTWTRAELERRENLVALAELMRSVHALPVSGVEFDTEAIAARYAAAIPRDDELRRFAARCEGIARAIPLLQPSVCCHNDIVAANILQLHVRDSQGLCLLDWEYACDNDPLFDLASLIGYHDLGDAEARLLLEACTGVSSIETRELLARQLRLFDAVQWLWLAARHAVAPDSAQRERLRVLARRIADSNTIPDTSSDS